MHPLEGSVATTAASPRSGWVYLKLFIVAFALLLMSTVIAGLSPECKAGEFNPENQNQPYYYGQNYSYYEKPMYCFTTFCFVPPIAIVAVVTGSLTFASLSQLAKTLPMHASTVHFQCMIVWALILTSMNLVVSINLASFASVPSYAADYSYYECNYYYNSNCAEEEAQFHAWIQAKRNASRFHHTFYIIVCWLWVGFVITSIVVQSRIKYWCCRNCKRDCQACVMSNEDACESCRCCVYAPGDEQAVQQLTVLGGPTVVSAGVVVPAPPIIQNTEVHYWLTNEIRLPQYTQLFVEKGYDRMDAIVLGIRSEQDLRKVVPNILPGHVVLILQNLAIKQRQAAMVAQPPYGQAVRVAAAPVASAVVAIPPMQEGVGTA